MSKIAATQVIRGGFWLYISMITNNLGGFIYWLIISRIAGSEILGLTSATIGLASMVNGLVSLGLGIGLQHHLGQCRRHEDPECTRRYFWSTIIFSTIIYVLAGLTMIACGSAGITLFAMSPEMIKYAGFIVLISVSGVLSASLIGVLRPDIVAYATITGNILKISLGITLVSLGYGFLGALLGYTMIPFSQLIIGFIKNIQLHGTSPVLDMDALRSVIRAGIVSWVPSIIILAGQWIGVLAVFGSSGAMETGHYYVAFVIANFVLGIGISMLNLLLPVLSGMSDGRKRTASKIYRITLTLLSPVAIYLFFYPWLLLGLLGREYTASSNIFQVLILSMVPITFTAMINSLIYSYKKYRDVLFLGLSQNIPRIALYLILVPLASGLGAAVSYTLGSFMGFIYAVYLAYKIKFYIDWRVIGKIILPPTILGLACYFLGLHWLISAAAFIAIYLLYGRLSILEKQDIVLIARSFLGQKLTEKIYEKLAPLIDHIYP